MIATVGLVTLLVILILLGVAVALIGAYFRRLP